MKTTTPPDGRPTYFIRHKFAVSNETRDKLWREQLIAIHYPYDKSGNEIKDSQNTNPDGYSDRGARTALKALNALATSGGYVYAKYPGGLAPLLGYVEPGSQIKLFRGEWDASKPGRPAILKTIQLHKAKLMPAHKAPVFAVAAPRQGTITRWPNIRSLVANYVEGRHAQIKAPGDLADYQQEVLCSEFLRHIVSKQQGLPRLQSLLLPIGRTMEDVDIYGIADDGRKLIAQVTYFDRQHQEAKNKLERLRAYGGTSTNAAHLLFFCQCDAYQQSNGVHIFPLQSAFELFAETEVGQAWLKNRI